MEDDIVSQAAPLDPDVRILLDAMNAAPPVESLGAVEARRVTKQRRAAMPQELVEVASVTERDLDGPGGPLRIRIYRPAVVGVLPAVVFLHGGGWVICDLDSHDAICRRLANGTSSVVVSVDYRLAPEHRYPAALDDAYAAVQWVASHTSDLGVAAERIAVAGDSAGGNLAAAVCLRARDEAGPAIAAQLLIYPVLDHAFDTPSYAENADGYGVTRASMRWYWEQYLGDNDGSDPYASPLRAASLAGLPPAVVITAHYDPLRDEGDRYAARLTADGVDVRHLPFPGVHHGFFGSVELIARARDANEAAFAAFSDLLHPDLRQEPDE